MSSKSKHGRNRASYDAQALNVQTKTKASGILGPVRFPCKVQNYLKKEIKQNGITVAEGVSLLQESGFGTTEYKVTALK